MSLPFVHFFLGGDPAPSDTQRADDGALAVAAAYPRNWRDLLRPRLALPGRVVDEDAVVALPENAADWYFDFVWARRFTAKEKMSARQWSGFIHGLHHRFGLAKVVLDPGGGGTYVKRELIAAKQIINGVETACTPIGDQVDGPRQVVNGNFILHMFKRGDPGVELVWPDAENAGKSLAGDELLKDGLFSKFKEALDHTQLGFPPDVEEMFGTRRKEIEAWPEERRWALTVLDAGRHQLANIVVATTDKDGEQVQQFTKRGARIFTSLSKDDIAFAKMYAYAGFLMWLRGDDWRSALSPEDAVGFSGF